jgi:chemotaxis protein MotA
MNISSFISFLAAFTVLGIGLYKSSNDPKVFVDGISAFIVIGGTLTATAISFRMEKIFFLIKIFIRRVLSGKSHGYSEIIENLMKIANVIENNPDEARNIAKKSGNFFLMESIDMVTDGFLEADNIYQILLRRVENIYQYYLLDANKFKSIGKFPPAFGMMGTTIGMIVLLSNLGGADAMKMIGPAMAICLITTLYGVAIANLIIIPIAENLNSNAKEIKIKNTMIAEGIKLIIEGKNPVVLAEELNSFLLPLDRLDWKEVIK